MNIRVDDFIETDGPGLPWRGYFKGKELLTTDQGQVVWRVILKDAYRPSPVTNSRIDVLSAKAEVLAFAFRTIPLDD